jgi:hypothetical protein
MVLYVMKWDIHPDKLDAYIKWTAGAIKSTDVGARHSQASSPEPVG